DAGESWRHCGLEATHDIARMVLDPADSNVAYVAAMGRLWGENPERGVFKTTDGGKSWAQVLKVDARTGAIDLVMDPRNSRTLYAAMYSRIRHPWSYTGGSRTGGIFRTMEAGRPGPKPAGGLPPEPAGAGLDIYRRTRQTLFGVIAPEEGGPLAELEKKSRGGGVFRSEDGGDHWTRLSPFAPRPFYFSQI